MHQLIAVGIDLGVEIGDASSKWYARTATAISCSKPTTRSGECRSLFWPLINNGYAVFLNDKPKEGTETFVRAANTGDELGEAGLAR